MIQLNSILFITTSNTWYFLQWERNIHTLTYYYFLTVNLRSLSNNIFNIGTLKYFMLKIVLTFVCLTTLLHKLFIMYIKSILKLNYVQALNIFIPKHF